MKKILVIPNYNNLESILTKDISGIILPIKKLSCNFDEYFEIEDIKQILNNTSMEVDVIINKIMHNEDISYLERVMSSINKLNIKKIFFYDLSVLNIFKKLGMKKELVIFQDHLNASNYSNNFYQKRGINYSLITNDITKDEINEISKYNKLMIISYGYLPIFYSRRYLVSNYLKYIGKNKNNNLYYIKHNNSLYPIKEEEYGTAIYTEKPINLINLINDINASYIILNSFNIKTNKFLNIIDEYIDKINNEDEDKSNDNDNYIGFISTKTVYKVEDYE